MPELIDLLERGDPREQYGALLALRELGADAWAEGYEDDLRYVVTPPGGEALAVSPPSSAMDQVPAPSMSDVVWQLAWPPEVTDAQTVSLSRQTLRALERLTILPRLRGATRVWRNVYVAARVGGSLFEGDIDFLFEEAGSLHLIEVKISPTSETRPEVDEQLQSQLLGYAAAVSSVMKQHVADATVLFLAPTSVRELHIPLPEIEPEPGPSLRAVLKLAG